jgi:hypothetical protein
MAVSFKNVAYYKVFLPCDIQVNLAIPAWIDNERIFA